MDLAGIGSKTIKIHVYTSRGITTLRFSPVVQGFFDTSIFHSTVLHILGEKFAHPPVVAQQVGSGSMTSYLLPTFSSSVHTYHYTSTGFYTCLFYCACIIKHVLFANYMHAHTHITCPCAHATHTAQSKHRHHRQSLGYKTR